MSVSGTTLYLCASWYTRYGPGSSVGIVTGYGLDGPGIESRWGRDFSAPVQTGPGAQPASCTMVTESFPGVKSGPGRDADPSPPSSTVGHERVELYLYSPCRPYGLYRASVPIQVCTLPVLYPPCTTHLLSFTFYRNLCPVRLYHIFPHYLINGNIWRGGGIY